jgi:hypothetical protein
MGLAEPLNKLSLRLARHAALRPCTNFGHSIVESTHSPENTKLTNCDFPLTKKTEAVKNIIVL